MICPYFIESSREKQQYGVRAEDTVWIRHGILNVKQLREGDDEQMVADVAASILLGSPFPASKEEFDEIYDSQSEKHKRIERTLAAHGTRRLQEEIQSTFSVLTEVIDSQLPGPNGLRNLVRPGGETPFGHRSMPFLWLSLNYSVRQQKSPADNAAIVAALRNVGPRLKSARHYTSAEERTSNIDTITGAYSEALCEQGAPGLWSWARAGPGLRELVA